MLKIIKEWSVKRTDDKGTKLLCLAECECGNTSEYEKSNVLRGNSTRCRSCAIKSRADKRRKHGSSGSRIYKVWNTMKHRCNNPSNKRYERYGGRGIKVCDRWAASYEAFIDDMGYPEKGLQIDRIDNNGNYEQSNCRWVTPTENARNKSNNIILTVDGLSKTLSEWSEDADEKQRTIEMRVKRGWTHKRAIFGDRHGKVYNTPKGVFSTLKQVQDTYGMSSSGVHGRFKSNNFKEWRVTNG